MKKIMLVFLGLFFGALPAYAYGATYYVSTTGSDSNTGTQSTPFKTIQKAADIVSPGDTVIVAPGIYTASAASLSKCNSCAVYLSRGGTASAPVTFKSETKWGAKISGLSNTYALAWVFSSGANHIRIEDFEIFGFGNKTGSANGIDIYSGGANSTIVGNHIHDIGRLCTDTGNAQAGMVLWQNNVTVDRNVFHDIGRFSPGENGCSPTTYTYQNNDHAIYHSQGDNALIKNNIFYNIKHGYMIQEYPGARAGANILNNTFAFPNTYRTGNSIVINASMSNSTIANNIFYQPNTAGMRIYQGAFTNVNISNNITYGGNSFVYMNSNGSTLTGTPTGMSIQNNYDNTNPLLINPSSFDFRLATGSPAVDKGVTFALAVTDYDNNIRPQGSSYDIGAYEHVSNPVVIPVVPDPVTFNQHSEAENMTLINPMAQINDGDASAGRSITVASGSESTTPAREAYRQFSSPVTGNYYLWARIMGPTLSSDALYVGIDDIWDRIYPNSAAAYEWVKVENGMNSGSYAFYLTAGSHTLQASHGELGARLDSLFISSDPNATPPSPTTPPAPTIPDPTPIPPTPTPTPSTMFVPGQKVQTTSNLNVRSASSVTAALVGTQPMGSLGTILNGGQSADGYFWWNVNYDSGVDGWSVENYLMSYTAPVTPPPSAYKFIIGDRIHTTERLKVRATPNASGKALCTQGRNAYGNIIGGPQIAGGYSWWQVNYDSSCDGWSAENWLSK